MNDLENIVDEEACEKPVRSFWDKICDVVYYVANIRVDIINGALFKPAGEQEDVPYNSIEFALLGSIRKDSLGYQISLLNNCACSNHGGQVSIDNNCFDGEGWQLGIQNLTHDGAITQIGVFNCNENRPSMKQHKAFGFQVGVMNTAVDIDIPQYGLRNRQFSKTYNSWHKLPSQITDVYYIMNPAARKKLKDNIRSVLSSIKDRFWSLLGYDTVMTIQEVTENDTYLCKICGEEDSIKNSVQCPKCNTHYHRDCGEYIEKCPTMGCGTKIGKD